MKILDALKSACYYYPLNEIKYPWCACVAPVSFWIRSPVKNKRKVSNFSIKNNLKEQDIKQAS